LTTAARAQRHAGVARAMKGAPSGLDDVAHHTASAAELVQELGPVEGVPTSVTASAIDLLTSAADRSLECGSLRLAVRHATRAIDLVEQTSAEDRQLAHLRIVRADATIEQRNFSAAAADIDALQAIATRLHDVVVEAESHRLRGQLANVAGRMDEARSELGLAVDLLRRAERPDLLATALRIRGFVEMFTGSLSDASWFLGEADGLFRALGDERGMAYVEQHRAWISFLSGDLELARERLTHAADTLSQLGDRNGVGWAFGLLAFVEFFEGHFAEAETLADTVTREAEARGDEWAAGMMDTLRADLRLWEGHLEDAATFGEKARARFKRLDDKFGLIQALAPLLRAQVALGRNAASQRSSEELLALAESGRQGPFPLMAVAGAAMHRGNGALASAVAERAIAHMRANGGDAFEPFVVLAMAQAQLGNHEEALATIESIGELGRGHPFTLSVAAVVHALNGLNDEAIADADQVARQRGATYLDQVFAYVGAAGAAAKSGDAPRAELAAQAAVARAMGVGDVVATGLATRAFHAVTGRPHPAFDEHTQLGEGWTAVVRELCGSTA
jgi:tetratricopeptide (TPR) repeat protein